LILRFWKPADPLVRHNVNSGLIKSLKNCCFIPKKPQITSNKWVLSTQTNTYRHPTCTTPPVAHLITI
jgi:hypothetical protein